MNQQLEKPGAKHAARPVPITPEELRRLDKELGIKRPSGINWESEFLKKFLLQLVIILGVPPVVVWIPAWIQDGLGSSIGWEIGGQGWLPSFILMAAWLGLDVSVVKWIMAKMAAFSRFPVPTRSDQVSYEPVDIPIGGGNALPGMIIKGPNTPAKNAPVVIVCHGMGGRKEDFYPLGIPMSFLGFALLFYDSRGHGQARFGNKWDTAYIIKDFSKVVDFVEARAKEKGDFDTNQIIAWGASMGGGIVLNEAYLDTRVKFIIALCTWADFMLTATRPLKSFMEKVIKAGYEFMGINLDPTKLQNRMVSPIYNSFNRTKGFFDHPVWADVNNDYRVMLAHCKDDMVVFYKNFELNRDFLKMPRENYIVFDTGNHAFAGNETAMVGKMMLWLFMRGY
ncbi:MAG: alpha/beta hydrolase [Candidatus Sigynarchaeum springense]